MTIVTKDTILKLNHTAAKQTQNSCQTSDHEGELEPSLWLYSPNSTPTWQKWKLATFLSAQYRGTFLWPWRSQRESLTKGHEDWFNVSFWWFMRITTFYGSTPIILQKIKSSKCASWISSATFKCLKPPKSRKKSHPSHPTTFFQVESAVTSPPTELTTRIFSGRIIRLVMRWNAVLYRHVCRTLHSLLKGRIDTSSFP